MDDNEAKMKIQQVPIGILFADLRMREALQTKKTMAMNYALLANFNWSLIQGDEAMRASGAESSTRIPKA